MSAPKARPDPIPPSALRDPVLLLATGFGSGLIRPAPGTWGTLAALPLAALFGQLPWPLVAVLVAAAAAAGIVICDLAGRRLGVSDHGSIVWDEWVGVWLAICAFPFDWVTVGVGFVTFRLFDAAKPWPVSWADAKVPGGLGVMLDDVIAGLMAAVCVFGARALLL